MHKFYTRQIFDYCRASLSKQYVMFCLLNGVLSCIWNGRGFSCWSVSSTVALLLSQQGFQQAIFHAYIHFHPLKSCFLLSGFSCKSLSSVVGWPHPHRGKLSFVGTHVFFCCSMACLWLALWAAQTQIQIYMKANAFALPVTHLKGIGVLWLMEDGKVMDMNGMWEYPKNT